MSGIGPELPPHLLAKRKRKQEEEAENETSTDSGAKRSRSPGEGEKRRRVIGPAMPPAPLDERPQAPVNSKEEPESDDDDDFGPSLPSVELNDAKEGNGEDGTSLTSYELDKPASEEKLQRDEWMTMPPKQDDLAARMDPTKIRARGFNTGKGAKGASGPESENSAWNETPEQKQKRLADEMMGVSKAGTSASAGPPKDSETTRNAAAAQKIREHTDKTRGPSLLDQHTGRSDREPEDDPSKRAFDRDKDMGSGMRIGHSQRKEMLNKAAGFSSKFSGGSYL